MGATPESKVKVQLDKRMYAEFPRLAKVNPIGGPFSDGGVSDKLYCVDGVFVAVEVKATKPKPSELQAAFLAGIANAGGVALCVGDKTFVAFLAGGHTVGPCDNAILMDYVRKAAERVKAGGVV